MFVDSLVDFFAECRGLENRFYWLTVCLSEHSRRVFAVHDTMKFVTQKAPIEITEDLEHIYLSIFAV